jgi:hypothetical protein
VPKSIFFHDALEAAAIQQIPWCVYCIRNDF